MATYYVTTSGSSSNNGLSEGNAWDLATAFSNATAGDTIYVKAGNYGVQQRTFSASGNASNRIVFEGYITTPGDIVASNGVTFTTGETVNTAQGPSIIGTISTNRPNQNQGIQINGSYITWKNFQFQHYNIPFSINGNFNIVENVFTATTGNHNPSDLGGFSNSFPTGAYLGYGIVMSGNDCQLLNCHVVDAGAEGVRITNAQRPYAENVTVQTIKGVGPQGNQTAADGNGTDYHFLVGSNTSGGIFKNITILHNAGQVNPGHGICFKPTYLNPCTNHEVDGFLVENTIIETQFPETTFITYKNGTIRDTNNDARSELTAANISNASRYVTIDTVIFQNARFRSTGWNEAIYPDNPGYNNASRDCTVKNCLFYNTGNPYSAWAISYSFPNDLYTTENLTFDHCTVYDYPRLWEVDKPNTGISVINCIVDDIPTESINRYHDGAGPRAGQEGPFPLNVVYEESNFSNGFSTPSGINLTSLQPQFVNPAGADFSLQSSSPLKGQGVATSNYAAGLDLGYLGGSPPSDTTPPSVTNITVDNITQTSFRATWSLDENSKGQIYWDTTSHPSSTGGTVATDYPNSTGREESFLGTHQQSPSAANGGALPAGTTIYWRIYTEDAAGNVGVSAEQSTNTLPDNTTVPPGNFPWQQGYSTLLYKLVKT